MENASRALYMAAAVIIAFMILAILINVFKAGAKLNEDYDFKQSKEQLELFNSKFEIYDRNNNTISDIVSAINLAYSVNKNVEYDEVKSITYCIGIGNRKFSIVPREDLKKNEVFLNEPNYVKSFPNPAKIDSYDLLYKQIGDIKYHQSGSSIYGSCGISNSDIIGTDKLSKTYLDNSNNNLIYKYLFRCDKIEYNNQTGMVNYIQFTCYKNENWMPTMD